MSAVKKLLNTVEGAVGDAAQGLLFSDSHLAGVKDMNVIVRNTRPAKIAQSLN